jgi:hypothetical protein
MAPVESWGWVVVAAFLYLFFYSSFKLAPREIGEVGNLVVGKFWALTRTQGICKL